MGMNICVTVIRTINGKVTQTDHPEWNTARQANDREFPRLDYEAHCPSHDNDFFFHRPQNIDEARKAIGNTDWVNKKRYYKLMDILEQEPDAWIYISY